MIWCRRLETSVFHTWLVTVVFAVLMVQLVRSRKGRPAFLRPSKNNSISSYRSTVTVITNENNDKETTSNSSARDVNVWKGPAFFESFNEDSDNSLMSCQNTDPIMNSNMQDICTGDIRPWSCSGRCGDGIVTNPCSCHVACLVHDSCCYDFRKECPDMYTTALNTVSVNKNPISNCFHNSLIISNCPHRAHSREKRECEEEQDDSLLAYLSRPPVTDSKLLWNFLNYFCWRCWNLEGQAMPWRFELTLNTDETSSAFYISLFKKYKKNLDMIRSLPPDGAMHFPCLSASDVNCSRCATPADRNTCAKYHSNVQVGGLAYRNIHCLLCQENNQTLLSRAECHVIASKAHSDPNKYVADMTSQNQTILLTFNPDLHGQEAGKLKWSVLECDASCVAARCQPGVVHRDIACDDEWYIRTLAMKICILGEARASNTSCTLSHTENEQFALGNGTRILHRLSLSRHGRISLAMKEKLTFLQVKHVKQFMKVVSSSNVELTEIYDTELEEAVRFAVLLYYTQKEDTLPQMDMKVIMRADTQELYILLLHMSSSFLDEQKVVGQKVRNRVGKYLESRGLSFKMSCFYDMPGLLLDLDLLDNKTFCDGGSQASENRAGERVIELIALLFVGQFFINNCVIK